MKPLAEDGATLTREQAADVLEEILAGDVPEVETAALLAVLATRGEQAPELAGFVDVMRRHPCPAVSPMLSATNWSTASAPAAADRSPSTSPAARRSWPPPPARTSPSTATAPSPRAAALPMCSRPSACPSNSAPDLAVECLRETGFVFLFAPLYHPAMKALGPLRRALGFRTIFNLCRPAHQPRRRAHPGHRRARAQPRSAGRPHARARSAPSAPSSSTAPMASTSSPPPANPSSPASRSRRPANRTLKAARITPEMAGLPRATLDQFIGGDVRHQHGPALRRAHRHPRRAPRHCSAQRRRCTGRRRPRRRSERRRRPWAPRPSTPARPQPRWPNFNNSPRNTRPSSRSGFQAVGAPPSRRFCFCR